MNFQSPQQALYILGLDTNATRDDIKSAYHRLVAEYHPDALGEGADSDAFLQIKEAYDYLMEAYDRAYEQYLAYQQRSSYVMQEEPRIIGSKAAINKAATDRHFREEKFRQERKLQRERANRKKEIDRRFEAHRKQAEYEEAMMRIHAVRAAEISASIIEAILKGNINQ